MLRHRCNCDESWICDFRVPRGRKVLNGTRHHWFSDGFRREIWYSCRRYGYHGVRRLAAADLAAKGKDVKAIVDRYMELAAPELKKNDKVGGCLNLELKTKPACPARKGVNSFTREPSMK